MTANTNSLGNWIDALPIDLKALLYEKMKQKSLDDGEFLYHQGDHIRFIYQIVSGNLKMSRFSEDGEELLASLQRPGQCGGEVSIILQQPAMYSGVARGKLTVRVLCESDFIELRDQFPAIERALTDTLAKRYSAVLKRMTIAAKMPVRQQVLWLLSWLVEQNSEKISPQVYVIQGVRMSDLSQMLGVARQTLSRELHKLIEEGILLQENGKIAVCDLPRLQHLSNDFVIFGRQEKTESYSSGNDGRLL